MRVRILSEVYGNEANGSKLVANESSDWIAGSNPVISAMIVWQWKSMRWSEEPDISGQYRGRSPFISDIGVVDSANHESLVRC